MPTSQTIHADAAALFVGLAPLIEDQGIVLKPSLLARFRGHVGRTNLSTGAGKLAPSILGLGLPPFSFKVPFVRSSGHSFLDGPR